MTGSGSDGAKRRGRHDKSMLIVRLHGQRKNVGAIATAVSRTPLHVFNVLRRSGKWPDGHSRRPLRGLEPTIRRQYLSGKTLAQLAARYNVSRVAIFKAVRRGALPDAKTPDQGV